MLAQGLLFWEFDWLDWSTCLLLNVLFALWAFHWIHRSYRAQLSQLKLERTAADEAAALHSRTIETLALAIDGKDQSSRDDFRRVRTYAVEIGKALGLPDGELNALRAAAVLRDIGKLGVPEHIVSKPGCLTPAEFEKMKAHPLTGYQILAQVGFPFPVAPIVRAHHEKWDGTGYPDGLRGEEIPIGARILAAVDCLGALGADRAGRPALSLDEAVRTMASEAGRSFDPRVVEVIEERCREFEGLTQSNLLGSRCSRHAMTSEGRPAPPTEQAARELFDLTTDLGRPLSLSATLAILEAKLARMVPYDSMAVYGCRDGSLAPLFAKGVNSQLFSEMPVGEGLTGRVAETREPMVNGNPETEPGCRRSPEASGLLRSALSVPLEDPDSLIGVLTLYHCERNAFTNEHLRLVQSVAYGMAQAVQTGLACAEPQTCSGTDSLTGLPNARSLFLHLDRELARSKRTDQPLTVLVCGLNGLARINDHSGRSQGDKVLKIVGRKFKESCREYDFVSRMGGDEFVLVYPDRSPELVSVVRARLCRAVAEAGQEVCGEDVLQASFGDGQFPRDGNDAEELLVAAGRRAFAAKRDRKAAPVWP